MNLAKCPMKAIAEMERDCSRSSEYLDFEIECRKRRYLVEGLVAVQYLMAEG